MYMYIYNIYIADFVPLNQIPDYPTYIFIFILFLNVLLTTKSRGGYGRHEKETKIK